MLFRSVGGLELFVGSDIERRSSYPAGLIEECDAIFAHGRESTAVKPSDQISRYAERGERLRVPLATSRSGHRLVGNRKALATCSDTASADLESRHRASRCNSRSSLLRSASVSSPNSSASVASTWMK